MVFPFSSKVAREGSALVIQRESLARLPDLVEKCCLATNALHGHLVSELRPLIQIWRPKRGFSEASLRWVVYLGDGCVLWRRVVGVCPACPGEGGRGRGGIGTSTLVTCLGSQGTLCPCSSLMIRVGRPWNLLLLVVGPGPISLMHSARSNKSSSEGDTTDDRRKIV